LAVAGVGIDGIAIGMGAAIPPVMSTRICAAAGLASSKAVKPAPHIPQPFVSSEVETRSSTRTSLDFARDERKKVHAIPSFIIVSQ
jgi:hypothetical protein